MVVQWKVGNETRVSWSLHKWKACFFLLLALGLRPHSFRERERESQRVTSDNENLCVSERGTPEKAHPSNLLSPQDRQLVTSSHPSRDSAWRSGLVNREEGVTLSCSNCLLQHVRNSALSELLRGAESLRPALLARRRGLRHLVRGRYTGGLLRRSTCSKTMFSEIRSDDCRCLCHLVVLWYSDL